MTTSSLQVAGIELWYDSFHALRGIDLDLPKGEFLALLGPSGCGKTSLLRSIAGFAHPQKGAIRIDGKDVTQLRAKQRNLGMVFQNYALFPHLTAAENVAFGLHCRRVAKAEIETRVMRTLDLVGLKALADRKPRQLSGGQQQRVALARALVIEPDLLLLDEPLGALDRKLRIEMQSELRSLQKRLGVTAVFVTHDQEEALAMADQIAIMRDGKIEQLGGPQDIFSAPASRWAAEFVGSGNLISGVLIADANVGARLDVAGFDVPVAGAGDAKPCTIFLRAEQIRLTAADDKAGIADMPRVVSQRYLGIHYEVHVSSPAGPIRSLVDPATAAGLSVGTPVTIAANAGDARILSETA